MLTINTLNMKQFRVPISEVGRGRQAESWCDNIRLLHHQLDKGQDPRENWWEP